MNFWNIWKGDIFTATNTLKTLSENWILLKRGQKIAGHTSEKEKKALKNPMQKIKADCLGYMKDSINKK